MKIHLHVGLAKNASAKNVVSRIEEVFGYEENKIPGITIEKIDSFPGSLIVLGNLTLSASFETLVDTISKIDGVADCDKLF